MALTVARTVSLGALLAILMLVSLPLITGAQRGPRVGESAPEITGGPWINSEPLSIEELRGRVVFVEFWTYG